MNFQQLEYIIALDTYRHFATAAEHCFVTQATLSMMIKKLEEELDTKLFDRSRQPVVPTDLGEKLIQQARIILLERDRLFETIQLERQNLSGTLRIGIIPTLAPFLLPLFLPAFIVKYPDVKLVIKEWTTDDIVHKLVFHQLDVGILATPLDNKQLHEDPLFYEEFLVYAAREQLFGGKQYLLAEDIDINHLWLLEEGHCLREQVINLCELTNQNKTNSQLEFAASSIETLKRMVEINQGVTILPMLALADLKDNANSRIHYFAKPVPVREIGLVTYRNHTKEQLIEALKKEILALIPDNMKQLKSGSVVL
jgi:LysR family transcriptional regulator, hydrogen peroxide-inducible genes activator